MTYNLKSLLLLALVSISLAWSVTPSFSASAIGISVGTTNYTCTKEWNDDIGNCTCSGYFDCARMEKDVCDGEIRICGSNNNGAETCECKWKNKGKISPMFERPKVRDLVGVKPVK